jgi:glutamyl-tRNA synthetase
MGYTMPDEREMFTLDEFVAEFDIGRVALGGPIFDPAKLAWLSGRWLREKCDTDQVLARLKDWMLNDDALRRIVPLVQPRADRLSDMIPAAAHLFADMPVYDAAALIGKDLPAERVARLLQIVLWELEKVRPWEAEQLHQRVRGIAKKEDVKLKELMPVLFVALSGAPVSLPLFESMEILGGDMTRRRLMHALDKLADAGHAISKKLLKQLETDYAAIFGAL